MAKMSLRIFKKGKPIYWVIGAVVVFVAFYMLFSGGSKSSSGGGGNIVVQQSGPSEAAQLQAAQISAQLQSAQISGNIEAMRVQSEAALGQRSVELALAELSANQAFATQRLIADSEIANLNAETNLAINRDNLAYGADTAQLAAQTQVALRSMDIGLLNNQMATNARLFERQSAALVQQSLIQQVGSLKKKDRDTALAAITAANAGQGFSGGKGDDYISFGAPTANSTFGYAPQLNGFG